MQLGPRYVNNSGWPASRPSDILFIIGDHVHKISLTALGAPSRPLAPLKCNFACFINARTTRACPDLLAYLQVAD
jgi:hypothetical protein